MSDVRNNTEKNRFEIDLGGSVALAAYRLMPGAIAFTHTQVPPSYEGQGIGTMLIKAGLAYAREHDLKVIPACRFFAAYMTRHSEVQDLLNPEQRERLGIA